MKFIAHSHQSVRVILDMKSTQFKITENDRYGSEIGWLKFPDTVIGLLKTYPDVMSSGNYRQDCVFHNELKEQFKKTLFSKFPSMISGFESYTLSWKDSDNDPLHKELHDKYEYTMETRRIKYQNTLDACAREVLSVVLDKMRNEALIKEDIIKTMKELIVEFASDGYNMIEISTKYGQFSCTSSDKTKYKTLGRLQFVPSISSEIVAVSRKTMHHNSSLDRVLNENLLPVIMKVIQSCFGNGFVKIDEVTFQISF